MSTLANKSNIYILSVLLIVLSTKNRTLHVMYTKYIEYDMKCISILTDVFELIIFTLKKYILRKCKHTSYDMQIGYFI